MQKLALVITIAAGLFTATACSAQPQDCLLNIIDRALTVHDYSTVLEYVDNRGINYFDRENSSRAYIKKDIINDSRTYSRCKTTVYPATFRTISDGNITTESAEEDTEEWENSGKHHLAYCLFSITYSNARPIRLISMNRKVMNAPEVGTVSGDFRVAPKRSKSGGYSGKDRIVPPEPTPDALNQEVSPGQKSGGWLVKNDTFGVKNIDDLITIAGMINDNDFQAITEMVPNGEAIELKAGIEIRPVKSADWFTNWQVRVKGSPSVWWISVEDADFD